MQTTQTVIPIVLDTTSETPLYQQLAQAFRGAISEGRLRPGDIVDSTRSLATALGVSRFTVNKCFDLLISQGFIEACQGSRMKVGRVDVTPLSNPQAPLPIIINDQLPASKYQERLVRLNVKERENAAPSGSPADLLPTRQWRQCILKNLHPDSPLLKDFQPEPLGVMQVRQALAAYLGRARKIRCSPEQIVVFSGITTILDLICRLILNPGDLVCVGDPGLQSARRVFKSHAAELIACPTDEDGMRIDELAQMDASPTAIHVMPSHHNPTGAVLSPSRRFKLLDMAQRTNMLILEDDFDNHFRYASKPMPSLKALDRGDSVVYMSDLGNLLYPAVSIGYAIFPERLMPAISSFKNSLAYDLSRLDQLALADFIDEGFLERHIRRLRPIYARRRALLIQALIRYFGTAIEIPRESAGLCMTVHFHVNVDEERIAAFSEESELKLYSTRSSYFAKSPLPGEFVIPFAPLTEETISDSVQALARVILG